MAERAEKIKLRYQDVDGLAHELSAEGLLAVAIQHEMDHLEPCRIQNPLRRTIQRILDFDQIAGLICERRGVVQRIFDRERLALGIDRDGDAAVGVAAPKEQNRQCLYSTNSTMRWCCVGTSAPPACATAARRGCT